MVQSSKDIGFNPEMEYNNGMSMSGANRNRNQMVSSSRSLTLITAMRKKNPNPINPTIIFSSKNLLYSFTVTAKKEIYTQSEIELRAVE